MLSKGETSKLEAKKRHWDLVLHDFNNWFNYWKYEFSKEARTIWKKYIMNWYFFYKPKDKGDKALHILGVLFVDLIILRVFGLI